MAIRFCRIGVRRALVGRRPFGPWWRTGVVTWLSDGTFLAYHADDNSTIRCRSLLSAARYAMHGKMPADNIQIVL